MKTLNRFIDAIAIISLAVIFFFLYLLFGSTLISGVFNTDFSMWQFAQANILLWFFGGIFKYLLGIKIQD